MTRETPDLDLLVLGGGTAGLVAAVIAGGLGARVALVERDRTGGECLWTGCVPSKGLLEAAHLAHRMRHADALGLTPADQEVDLRAVMDHVRAAQAAIAPHDSAERLAAAGAEVIADQAVFVGPRRVRLTAADRELTARRVLLAVGSEPALPPVDGLERSEPLTTDTVWDLDALPEQLVVLGGGPVGCELGQAFARLGSRVTIVEQAPRLLPTEDPEVGELLARSFTQEGIDVRTGTAAVRVERADGWRVGLAEPVSGRTHRGADWSGATRSHGLKGGGEVVGDRLLVSAGRRPRTSGLGLERAGVDLRPDGAVRVDAHLRATAKGVYAAGDVTGLLPFTHVSAYQAALATVNALSGLKLRARYRILPYAIFTDPEIARVGLTEAQARRLWGDRTVVARLDHRDVDRAVVAARTEGFTQLVAAPGGRLVGATVVGPSAGEGIAELAAAVARGARIWSLAATVHPYPTYAQGAADAVSEHIRAAVLTPALRAFTRPVLGALRRLGG